MEIEVWQIAAAGGALAANAVLLWSAPAKTSILVDTAGSAARAEMRLLWGLGPKLTARALPREAGGNPLAVFNEPAQIGYALMTPGVAEAAYEAVRRLFQLKPRFARVGLALNLGDSSQNLVVQTAAQAAIAAAPAALRDAVSITKCEAPGAELSAAFELSASPMQLASIWGAFKNARSVREFRKRLRRVPKASRKAPREVRAT
jgi:hypothetical protein